MSSVEGNTILPGNADNSRTTILSESDTVVQTESFQSLALQERLIAKMLYYSKELCFFAAILFTSLAAMHTSPPKISKPPAARPFFNHSSIVQDFYKGQLGAAIETVEDADFSFIMYYAPWDAESQAVREEFEIVARYFHEQIYFAAINCWQPGSECQAQYSKIHSYPVLILYPRRGSGIQYHGAHIAPYMIRFLHAAINPIVRITSTEQLMNLIVDHDAVVIGYFNFSGPRYSPGFETFYKSAIRWLEKDPNRELAFAAITDAISSERDYGIVEFPSARLFMWNESLSYPLEYAWNPDSLLKWVGGSLHQAALWIQPPGKKSLTLAPYLRDGPVLFLFTPRNPFHDRNYNYNLMKEIGLQYYKCGDNPLVENIIKRLISARLRDEVEHHDQSKRCTKYMDQNENQMFISRSNMGVSKWTNESCSVRSLTDVCLPYENESVLTVGRPDDLPCFPNLDNSNKMCERSNTVHLPTTGGDRYSSKCQQNDATDHKKPHWISQENENGVTFSPLVVKDDPQCTNDLTESVMRENCRRFLAGNNYHSSVFPRNIPDNGAQLSSKICESNKTLALLAIDSLQFFYFAEGLGVDVLSKRDRTAVVIIDPAEESQYVLEKDLNYVSLVEFVNNFTHHLLERNLQSRRNVSADTEYNTEKKCHPNEKSTICIPELTTNIFLQTILDPNQNVVVMYYSPYCAFCNAVSYVYLSVARYLRDMHNLTFVRINGDSNDLPWEYTMNRYPAILFFPAKRKEDSTVFPFSLPINVPNLLNFILVNLDGDSHVEALVNICHSGIGDSAAECVARIRWLTLDMIENLLRSYRQLRRNVAKLSKKTANKKVKMLFLRLQHIREIHLTLGSINDLKSDVNKTQFIRDKFKSYYQELSALDVHTVIDSGLLNHTRINISYLSEDKQEL